MNGPRAFCPRCQKDVLVEEVGQFRRCAVCGMQFERESAAPFQPDFATKAVMTVSHVLLRVFLILAIVLLVGLGLLFATCAMH